MKLIEHIHDPERMNPFYEFFHMHSTNSVAIWATTSTAAGFRLAVTYFTIWPGRQAVANPLLHCMWFCVMLYSGDHAWLLWPAIIPHTRTATPQNGQTEDRWCERDVGDAKQIGGEKTWLNAPSSAPKTVMWGQAGWWRLKQAESQEKAMMGGSESNGGQGEFRAR